MSGWTGASEPSDSESGTGVLALPADMEPAVSAFLLASTQWRWASEGRMTTVGGFPVVEIVSRRTGLDYGALRDALALHGRALTAEDFASVRVMEAHALKFLARR